MERESMEFDVVIVGAGPSGLAAACRLMQLAKKSEPTKDLTVCIVEKGSEVGAHILSGAVFEPRALDELFPDWKDKGAPLTTPVTEDEIYYLKSQDRAWKIPYFLTHKTLHNDGNYIISLGNLCRWLEEQAIGLDVEIFSGFPAQELIIEDDKVKGIITGDMGQDEVGGQKDSYMPGMELRAKYTIFAEGCRGHLGKQLISEFKLDANKSPQHYGLGIKELWDIPKELHKPGLVVHTAGWPLSETNTIGGGFLYHIENNQVVVGLITDLNYSNPYVSPFDEFQRFKHSSVIKKHLASGSRISYGARAITKGGIQSLPKMTFPGGLIIGCDAGTLNYAKIKGSHTAMKSGMVAAESLFELLTKASGVIESEPKKFTENFKDSWAFSELKAHRNFGPLIHKFGTLIGGGLSWLDINIFNGKLPFTINDNKPDYLQLKLACDSKKLNYPKPDNKLSFDKQTSVFLSNTNHEENQPCHLKLTNQALPIQKNLPDFDEPAQRYCPAGVYEIINDENNNKKFVINSQNCVHCKTCDIKDPCQNITWVAPEGGGGPNYPNM